MRERELKHAVGKAIRSHNRSLPMRERELKLQGTVEKWRAGRVAPHAGARIETAKG